MFPLPSHSRPEIGEAGGAFSGEGFGGAQGSAEGGHLLTTTRSTTGRQGKARGGRRGLPVASFRVELGGHPQHGGELHQHPRGRIFGALPHPFEAPSA